MASIVKIESFDVNVTAATGQTHTLTNTVTLANAFVRRTTSIDKQSGPTTSTSNANPNVSACAAYLSSTTQISFVQNSTTSQKVIGEVWRYTGTSGGADEFIVRGRHTIALSASTATNSAAVSGISDRDKCIPFWTGTTNANTSVNDYDSSTVAVWIDGSDNIQVARGSTTGAITIYVTVVEFTGSNWSVGHVRSTSHDASDPSPLTMNTNSLATTGTFDVGDWETATIIEASLEGDAGGETGLSDNLACWSPHSDTSKIVFTIHQDANARNDGVAYAHILRHPAMIVKRAENTNFTEGNGSYTNATWPTGASTTESLDELALEWFCDTTGVGTAHARGRLSARITAATGTIQTWVHRSGNNVRVNYGVIDLSGVDGTGYLNVSDVDTDEIISNSQTNVVITGADFESSQGTGKVELVENNDYTGTKVEQTSIDSWSDTEIQFDASAGALADSRCYLFVTNDSGSKGYIPVVVGVPPETYDDVVEGLTGGAPDHWWKLQNNYNDDGDSMDNRPMTQNVVGTHEFDTSPVLVRGNTYALRFDSVTDSRRISDVDDMNMSALAARSFGCWVSFGSIQKAISTFYNEGGGVNNLAFSVGVGNRILAQLADTGDDNVHVYGDIPLNTDRPYFILFTFDYNDDNEFKFYIDGIKQSNDNGNPLTSTGNHLDSHSGDVVFGKPETNLEVFGTDVSYDGNGDMHSAHWFSFTRQLSETEITELFAKGATPKYTIDQDTQSNMQSDIDLLADTEVADYPIGIQFKACTDGDFEIEFDNITFDSRCTIEISYFGTSTLDIIMKNGTVIDSDKISIPYSGTVNLIKAPPINITCKNADTKAVIEGVRVLVLADTGGDLPYQDSVTITRVSTTATVSHTAHGLRTGQEVLIKGANQEEYNGIKTITVTTVNAYTFTVSGTPTTPATGTITCTSVILEETSNASGIVTVSNHRYTSNQPITVRARSHSGTTKYQQGNLSATITSSGFSGNILMVEDE
jgi:hypothetical protein